MDKDNAQIYDNPLSRRQFIKSIALGTSALAGLTSSPFAAALVTDSAAPSELLSFRQNQPILPLHYNENSLGMSPNAMTAAKEAIALHGNRYQDAGTDQLKDAISKTSNIPSDQILLGNGSTDVLGTVVSYANSMGATLLEPKPTFGDVRSRCAARRMKIVKVSLASDFVTDIDQLKQQAAKISGPLLINICNPNNPTGTITDSAALKEWILSAPANYLFLIDEAYHEYATLNPKYSSMLPLIAQGKENVVVTRTFSKIYGMAGMRVGYGFCGKQTASKLDEFSSSFNLTAAGIAAAIASLNDNDFYEKSLSVNQESKSILTTALNELELNYINGNTNFILHRINSDLSSYSRRMLKNNVKVGRRMTDQDGWNRISLGQPHEMKAFVNTLRAFRENGWV